MKTVQKLLLGTLLSATTFSHSLATELTSSANVSLSSDYVFRGVSQTNEDPAIQGGYDIAIDSGWYAGIWASNIGFGEGSLEADLYAGWRKQVNNDWAVDFGLIRYLYPSGNAQVAEFNYNEVYSNVTYKRLTINLVYSDDYFGSGVDRFYYLAGDYNHPVSERLSVNIHAGLNQFESDDELTQFLGAAPANDDSYWDWSVGLNYQLTNEIGLGITYIGTDISGQSCVEICDSRVVAGLSATF